MDTIKENSVTKEELLTANISTKQATAIKNTPSITPVVVTKPVKIAPKFRGKPGSSNA